MKNASIIIRVTLILMIVVTPWFFGGVWAMTQWMLLLLAAVLLSADLLTRFGRYDSASWIPTIWLPLLLGIGLGVFQLIPWSPKLAKFFAPHTMELRNQLTSPAIAGDADPKSKGSRHLPSVGQTRSLYPAATREYLSLLALATAVLLLASSHAIDRASINYLFVLVSIFGAAFSFFGLVQRLSWNGKFYWLVETATGSHDSFGPYVNRNNAGGLLNMCLAAGLGLLITMHWKSEKFDSKSGYQVGSKRKKRSRSDKSDRIQRFAEVMIPRKPPAETSEPKEITDQPSEDLVERYAAMLDPSGQDATTFDSTGSDAQEPSSPTHSTKSESTTDASELSSDRLQSSLARQRVKVREKVRTPRSSQEVRSERFAESARRSNYSIYSKRQPFVVRVSTFFSDYFASVNARKLWSVALVALIAGGVICTASRGSIVAMFVAALVTASGLAAKTGYRGYAVALIIVLLAGTGLMNWAGQTEYVESRLAKLFDDENLQTGRLPNWREALETVPDYWTMGSGLGTYRNVYEPFQNRYLAETTHFHAENQYLQALVEGGVLALGLLIVSILFTGCCIFRLLGTGSVTDTSLAITGTFALASQVVGGAFDFGLYIPANTLLMAMICGVVIGRAALVTSVGNVDWLEQKPDPETGPVQNRLMHLDAPELDVELPMLPSAAPMAAVTGRRLTTHSLSWSRNLPITIPVPALSVPLTVALLLITCVFASLEMHKTSLVERAMEAAPLLQVREADDPAVVLAAMKPFASVLGQRWDDANAHRHYSELQQQMYRAKTYQRLVGEARKTGAEPTFTPGDAGKTVAQRDDSLWRRASTWHLHRTVRALERAATDRAAIDRLLDQPEVVDHLLPALRHMTLARQFCPTIPHVHYALAELSVLREAEPAEEIHLARAKTLSPADATLLYWSGVLEFNSNRIEQACADWKHSLTLSALHLDEIMSNSKLSLRHLDQVFPARSDLLLHVAQTYFADGNRVNIRRVFLERAEQAIPQTELPAEQQAIVAANIYRLLGKPQEARPHYEKAVSLLPQDLNIQYEFAVMLFEMKELEAAREIARSIYHSRPVPAYRDLLEKIERAIVETTDSRTKDESPSATTGVPDGENTGTTEGQENGAGSDPRS